MERNRTRILNAIVPKKSVVKKIVVKKSLCIKTKQLNKKVAMPP